MMNKPTNQICFIWINNQIKLGFVCWIFLICQFRIDRMAQQFSLWTKNSNVDEMENKVDWMSANHFINIERGINWPVNKNVHFEMLNEQTSSEMFYFRASGWFRECPIESRFMNILAFYLH